MKKILFLLLLLCMGNQLPVMAQPSPLSKPIKIKVDIHVHFNWHRRCEEGLGLCIDHWTFSTGKTTTTGITEINHEDFLFILRSGLTAELAELFDTADRFPLDQDIFIPAEYLHSETVTGGLVLRAGNYPIQTEEGYYLIPIKTEYP